MRVSETARVDLHIHSTASDGVLTPSAVVEAARAGGLDIIAVADHDTAAGVQEAVEAAGGTPSVIPAIELSTTHGNAELHILGYHVDSTCSELREHARVASEARLERVQEMLRKLRGLGVALTLEQVIAAAEGGSRALGRPHVARALLTAGHVRTVDEAFSRWLADERPAFVPTELLTPRQAIRLIHAAGGAAIWAHPPFHLLERDIERFAASGLDGIECYRPRTGPTELARLQRTAAAYGLLVSGGSDWHGEWSGPLGTFFVPASKVAGVVGYSRRETVGERDDGPATTDDPA